MALIFALSSREQFPKPPGVSIFSISIVAHLILYGMLGLLLAWAVDRESRPSRSMLMAVIVLAVLYGVTDELHQSFVPGRDASVFDIAVDAVGACIAVLAWSYRRALRSSLALR
jgi:VanZ family protein